MSTIATQSYVPPIMPFTQHTRVNGSKTYAKAEDEKGDRWRIVEQYLNGLAKKASKTWEGIDKDLWLQEIRCRDEG